MRIAPLRAAALLALAGVCSSFAPAQAAPGSPAADASPALEVLEGRAREWLEGLRVRHDFPGACAAFVLRDGRIGAVAVGHVDGERKEPLTTRHRIFSGSIGKTYVAAVALQLVAAGELDLDAKVSTWLGGEPWFLRVPNHADLTLRMLLRHQSGVPEHVWKPEFHRAVLAEPDRQWRAAELVAFVFDDAPLFAAGDGFAYADTNYVLVGAVLEQHTGKSWFELLRSRLLEPLDLDETSASDRRDIPGLANGFASGMALHEGPTVRDGRYFVNPQFEWCGGGVCSTTRDLARWGAALLLGDVVPEPMRAAWLDAVEAPRVGGRYGLGVIVRDGELGPAHGHTGTMVGCLSVVQSYPQQGLTVALQWNTDDGRKLGGHPHQHADRLAMLLREAGNANGEPPTATGPRGGK